jgi:hypothetical protein
MLLYYPVLSCCELGADAAKDLQDYAAEALAHCSKENHSEP